MCVYMQTLENADWRQSSDLIWVFIIQGYDFAATCETSKLKGFMLCCGFFADNVSEGPAGFTELCKVLLVMDEAMQMGIKGCV